MATIYPGLPEDSLRFRPDTGDYLAYLGPVSSTTLGPSLLSLAHDTGIPFRVAGSMPPSRHDAEQLTRDMKRHDIEYLGEITQADEEEFIGSALAVVLPEGNRAPSSLTTVEALACGTPVVTVAAHVDAELIEHGITGFVCPHSHDIASAVKQIDRLDRHHCRDAFEANFTLGRMVEEYLKVYTKVVNERVF
jgi:glycosyltransferase involved in cell wall biosynthesis